MKSLVWVAYLTGSMNRSGQSPDHAWPQGLFFPAITIHVTKVKIF